MAVVLGGGGGGGGASFFGSTLTATASGAIAAGDPVVLNQNGTVSSVAETTSTFRGPGQRLYVGGLSSDGIAEYTLSTAYDIGTASSPPDYFFKLPYVNPSSFKFNPTGTKLYIATGLGAHQYSLSQPFTIATAVYEKAVGVTWYGTQLYGIFSFAWNGDGSRIAFLNQNGASSGLYQYNVGTAYDIGTIAPYVFQGVGSYENQPRGFQFNSDGTKFYTVGNAADRVNEWTLSTAYQVNTATHNTFYYVGGKENYPFDLCFNSSGTKMYVTGQTSDSVHEYNLSTAFLVSSATFSQTFSVSSQEVEPTGIAFNTDTATATSTNLSEERFIGFASASASNGASVEVDIVGGINASQTGLLAGSTYYVLGDGSLTTSPGGPEAGYAISSTELLVKGAYSSVPSATVRGALPLQFDLGNVSKGSKLLFVSSTTWTPSATVEALVTVVGAGANGQNTTGNAGAFGGGAGGLCQSLLTLTAGVAYDIVVGAGFGVAGGSSSFSGEGISPMIANGGSSGIGGGAYGGNIINNKGGDGKPAAGTPNNFQGGGGGAIGITKNGADATTYTGASIDMIPSTFPYSEAEGWHLSNLDGTVGGGHFGGTGYGAYTYGNKIGAKGGVGSGGGGTGGYTGTHSGGGGGFPGGGGGGVSGENPRAGYGAFGCVVIEVL